MKNLTAMIILFPALGFADPGPATKYLMEEPASLLDIGLMRAALHFEMAKPLIESTYEVSDPEMFYSQWFQYDFENDLFVLRLGVMRSRDGKFRCSDLMQRYGNILTNSMVGWFGHEGYIRKNVPDGFERKLLDRVELRCSVDEAEGRRRLTASSDFIYWKE